MEFAIMVLINIVMGAIFYLIISLKLEKSAADFRERRLRKEMDEIIKEFNATADRNISLLENRIAAMKRLMDRAGDTRSLDVVLEDPEQSGRQEGAPLEKIPEKVPGERDLPSFEAGILEAAPGEKYGLPREGEGLTIRHGLFILAKKVIDILPFRRHNANLEPLEYRNAADRAEIPAGNLIEKDLSGLNVLSPQRVEAAQELGTAEPLSEEEIFEICSSGHDKVMLISMLHERGCSAETISKYSGIPQGEVRLVLNLHNSF